MPKKDHVAEAHQAWLSALDHLNNVNTEELGPHAAREQVRATYMLIKNVARLVEAIEQVAEAIQPSMGKASGDAKQTC